jgi:hypothetical protein
MHLSFHKLYSKQKAMNSDSEIGIGFSDRILLGVSIVGFTALVYVVHSLLSGLRNGTGSHNNSDDDHEADGLTDEERLIRCADVNSLNRTQRRVRAKAIMKEQRRLHHPSAELVDENDENGVVRNVDPVVEDRLPQPILSRKERQQQAKVAEKEERRLFQDERERQQKLIQLEAQRQKKERLIAATQRLLEEEQKKAIEEAAREEKERDSWYTFIMTTTPSETSPVKKTVAEFVQECQKNRVVDIQMMATQYNVEPNYIADRIKQLISDGRIAGFFQNINHEQQHFIYLSDDELHCISSTTRTQGCVSIPQFATICQQVIEQ